MDPATFVLFGATGDLAKRKIYPALYHLFVDGKLPRAFSLVGLGRREWTDDSFRANVEQSLRRFSRRESTDETMIRFLQAFRYCVLDIDREEHYRRLLTLVEQREAELGIPANRLFYLSVGPDYFGTIAANIRQSGLGATDGWKRLVIEKPFGSDLLSARELNRRLGEAFAERDIFRIDHYLGKPMVQRLATLLEADPAIRALWSRGRIASVQITADESVGVEERAGYYDRAGAIRDMFQNHMLQLLMMTAIHVPGDSGSGAVRSRKKQVLASLAPVSKEHAAANVIRGQYTAGSIGEQPVVGYTAEPGIAPCSANDTFVAARLRIDNDFWRGVPFYIRTGKRMFDKSTRVVVEFKEPPGPAAAQGGESMAPNLLVIEIGPEERITLHSHTQSPPIPVDLPASRAHSPEAYENLIGDALNGDPTFFAHWDEVELSWQWVQPVLEAFRDNLVPLHPYPAGSFGPAASADMLTGDGRRWWSDVRSARRTEIGEGERAHYAGHAHARR